MIIHGENAHVAWILFATVHNRINRICDAKSISVKSATLQGRKQTNNRTVVLLKWSVKKLRWFIFLKFKQETCVRFTRKHFDAYLGEYFHCCSKYLKLMLGGLLINKKILINLWKTDEKPFFLKITILLIVSKYSYINSVSSTYESMDPSIFVELFSIL